MGDPTSGAPDQPEPELPELSAPAGGDETVRVPVEPEVAWNAPESPRAMPWDESAQTTLPVAPLPGQPLIQPVDPVAAAEGAAAAPPTPTGLLSAATVGWVAPPPVPVATGNPGWVIASTGARFGAYLLDLILSGVIIGAVLALAVSLAPDLASGGAAVTMAYSIGVTGFFFLYFVGFWTSGSKATPGMRVFKLQVASAADGKRLAIGPAVIRWLALGYVFALVGVIPALAGIAGLVEFVWVIVLLVTTSNDPMHQGLHDRWAKSVVVRPETATSSGGAWVATCLVGILIIGLIITVPIVALLLMGDQLSTILSAVGASI